MAIRSLQIRTLQKTELTVFKKMRPRCLQFLLSSQNHHPLPIYSPTTWPGAPSRSATADLAYGRRGRLSRLQHPGWRRASEALQPLRTGSKHDTSTAPGYFGPVLPSNALSIAEQPQRRDVRRRAVQQIWTLLSSRDHERHVF